MKGTSVSKKREPLKKRLFFLATPLFLVFALTFGLFGYTALANFFGSVLTALFVYQLNISETVFGINIKRWRLWFSIECGCGFFYFSNLSLVRSGSLRDFLSRYAILYVIPLVFSLVFILYREFYFAPNRLQEYFEKNQVDIGKQKKIKKELRKEEIGLFLLSCIIALGLGNFMEIAVVVACVVFLYKILKIELMNRRYKSATEEFFKTHDNQLRSFWLNFTRLPPKVMAAFVLITFVCFINIPVIGSGQFASHDLILEPILIATLIILITVIKFKPESRKLMQLESLILGFAVIITLILADPSIFPFIRGVIEDQNIGTNFQFLLMFCFILIICASVILLMMQNRQRLGKKKS